MTTWLACAVSRAARCAAAAVLLRGARPQHVGPGDVHGAVGGLDDRRDAEVAQPREQHVERRRC